MDVEELLERTWTPAMAERIADAVAGPGDRGSIVRGVQPEAPVDATLYVFEEVADELARQTGVDVDHSRTASSQQAISDVLAVLTARWQDGGPLPAAPAALEETVRRHMAQLTLKAAEWAGAMRRAIRPRRYTLAAASESTSKASTATSPPSGRTASRARSGLRSRP